jgi:hypothetical protein
MLCVDDQQAHDDRAPSPLDPKAAIGELRVDGVARLSPDSRGRP